MNRTLLTAAELGINYSRVNSATYFQLLDFNLSGTVLADELGEPERKGANAMSSEILVASNSADRLNNAERLSLNLPIEKIARLGRLFAFASAVFFPFLFLVAFALG